jgi:hypothetical protein
MMFRDHTNPGQPQCWSLPARAGARDPGGEVAGPPMANRAMGRIRDEFSDHMIS